MKSLARFLLLGASLTVAACSGSTSESSNGTTPGQDAAPGDSATHDAADEDSTTPEEGGGDDALMQDAGPCTAVGTWVVTTVPEAGASTSETIVVVEGDGGGSVSVSFEDRETPEDQCSYPSDGGTALGTSSETGSFDAGACTLTLAWTESYCYSGEQQCYATTYELTVVGDSATGNMHTKGGWCMQQSESDTAVTATRTPL